jgi:hypothetical protein
MKKNILLSLIVFKYFCLNAQGGPAQPESSGFKPIGVSENVNHFTGDFSYSIPLLDLEGFPINLNYLGTVSNTEDASWVGLGWNINVGSVNRQMRGVPDEFNGTDLITKHFSIKSNITAGVNLGANFQLINFQPNKRKIKLGLSIGLFYNNYNGWGNEFSISPSFSLAQNSYGSLNAGMGLKSNSESGMDVTPSLSLNRKVSEDRDKDLTFLSLGTSINSRSGLKSLNFGISYSKSLSKSLNFNTGRSYSHSLISPSYTPTINMPMDNEMYALSVNVDGTIFGIDPGLSLMGHYSKHSIQKNSVSSPAFGFLYSEKGKNNEYAVLDFNREKDIAYNQNVPTIAVPVLTYDYFNVNLPTESMQFRAYKNSTGIVFDSKSENKTSSGNLGFEVGAGNAIQVGATINVTSGGTTTKKWNSFNNKYKELGDFAIIENDVNKVAESYFFKNLNEPFITNLDFLNKIKGEKALAVSLGGDGKASYASKEFVDKNNNLYLLNDEIKSIASGYEKDNIRNSNFSFITKGEIKTYGFEKNIYSYEGQGKSCINKHLYSNKYSKDHHISEITIIHSDGKRYIYGIPVYNNIQKEATFSISGNVADQNDLVSYSNTDASANNKRGSNNYFNAEIMPSYPVAWLLTAILSPDYQDLTGDGISDDDLGTAHKFNYTLKNREYQWRNPGTKTQKANFNLGLQEDPEDDKASYIYGTREEWYLHSIESKNMMSFFYLSEREDAYGINEHGGIDVKSKKYKLDSIALFTKSEFSLNGEKTPIALKKVHFQYNPNYPLCKGIENSITNKGKLTLDGVYFTYQTSKRGVLNKYSFKYDNNPDFKWKNIDRWGNYKNEAQNILRNSNLKTSEFPYTLQDKSKSDFFASAWLLSSITNPSGSIIQLKYESDDYAFVQNKRAAYMAPIIGFGNSPNSQISNNLYTFDYVTLQVPPKLFHANPNDYIFFQFDPNNKPPIGRPDILYKDYFEDLNNLDFLKNVYYRAKVDIFPDGEKEYVPGYLNIEDYGIRDENTGWIKVKRTEDANPISFSAWQIAKTQMPKKAYPWNNLGDDLGPLSLIMAIPTFITNLSELLMGYQTLATLNNIARTCETNKSYIRLLKPDNTKIGGGYRVKKITINDNWSKMINSDYNEATYGNEYNYETEKNGKFISSGVAEYEPLIGGDENPFRKPIHYSGPKGLFAPSSPYYVEEPICEGFYPNPHVGYSKVEVKSINSSIYNQVTSGTGKQIYEYFTAKDMPVYTERTNLGNNIKRFNPNFFTSFLKIDNRTGLYLSQGFYVETNDLHGKPKSEKNYNQKGALIAETIYEYNIMDHKLNNEIPTIDEKGIINPKTTIGLSFDFFTDMRHQKTLIHQVDVELGAGFGVAGIFPIFHFSPFPPYGIIENDFYSSSTMKHIVKKAIQTKTYKMNDGSSIMSENLLWDKKTGIPVVVKVNNEFEDPIYNVKYPAYWRYDEMKSSFSNFGLVFQEAILNGVIPPSINNFVNHGDEVIFSNATETEKLWVVASNTNNNEKFLINRSGFKFNGSGKLKIVHTGKKNILNENMFAASMLKSPLNSYFNPTSLSFNSNNLIFVIHKIGYFTFL